MRVKFAGIPYEINKNLIESKLQGVAPEIGRRFFIEVGGVMYPIKQAVSVAIGRPVTELGTNVCYATLRRLGFEIHDEQAGDRHD